MKKFILFLGLISVCIVAEAYTINWHIGNSIYQTTTCESGDNITPPTPPEKYGYHLKGWYAYRELEYLESTGTQWLDIPCSLNRSSVLEIGYQFFALSKSVGGGWFSVGSSGYNYYMQAPYGYVNINATALIKHTVKFDGPNNIIYIDDKQVFSSAQYSSSYFAGLSKYIVFSNGNKTEVPHSARLYHLKIWNNGVLTRDFIPVLDKDGIPCVFDKVSKTFFYNQGTGDFVAGPLVYYY